ncbi:MAG: hypothetical protein IK088_09140 [Lachnospiraceae bacterium]|nr:hypothetical protein [Lachnospiraceae bacterium]
MDNLQTIIKQKKEGYEKIIRAIEASVKKAPKGLIQGNRRGKRIQMYLERSGVRTYLKESDSAFASEIIQRSYDEQLLPKLKQAVRLLDGFLERYHPEALEKTYERQAPFRKERIDPRIQFPSVFLGKWREYAEKTAGIRNAYPASEEFTAMDGTKLRSKSEQILADLFERHRLIFFYELPLFIEGTPFFPDFTILDPENGKVVYWEHFGMMDVPNYANQALSKMNLFSKNGIVLGKNLIATFESAVQPLNVRHAEQMLLAAFPEKTS